MSNATATKATKATATKATATNATKATATNVPTSGVSGMVWAAVKQHGDAITLPKLQAFIAANNVNVSDATLKTQLSKARKHYGLSQGSHAISCPDFKL